LFFTTAIVGAWLVGCIWEQFSPASRLQPPKQRPKSSYRAESFIAGVSMPSFQSATSSGTKSGAAEGRTQRVWVMSTALPVLAGLLTLVAQPARSQSSKPDAAEAAAAMQRAERIASNPMRLILQAGKINRKTGADEPTAATAPAAATRAPAPVLVATTAAVSSGARLVPDSAAEPAPSPVVAELVYKADARMKAAAPQAFAPLSPAVAPTPLSVDTVSTAAPAMLALVQDSAPKLKRMVEVDLPPQVLDELRRGQEVAVKFVVAADGSVSQISLRSPAPRQLARLIQAAVSQWQFEPMAAAREHTVQLVFNAQ
jgi:hypothetical protein